MVKNYFIQNDPILFFFKLAHKKNLKLSFKNKKLKKKL